MSWVHSHVEWLEMLEEEEGGGIRKLRTFSYNVILVCDVWNRSLWEELALANAKHLQEYFLRISVELSAKY